MYCNCSIYEMLNELYLDLQNLQIIFLHTIKISFTKLNHKLNIYIILMYRSIYIFHNQAEDRTQTNIQLTELKSC